MREFTLAIVGIDFPNEDRARTNRRSELMMIPPGAPMELRPELRNRHDPHAVAVFSSAGVQVGYVSAERAPWIGARMRDGEEVQAIYQGLHEAAGYVRVRMGGGAPTLPKVSFASQHVREPSDDEAGFWPDPEGPEFGA